jgi:septum site-determining protein MinC
MSDAISIKGIREGLLVTLSDTGSWNDASRALLTRIEQSVEFFKGARLALALGPRPLSVTDLSNLRSVLSERNVSLWAVLSDSPATMNSAQSLGLNIALPSTLPQMQPDPETNPEEDREGAVMARRTLRSGRCVRHAGHVVIIGDVNPGAEVVAGGNIVVWGRLRGVAHAGADGDESAVVCALDLSPTQLRIAGHIATSPSRKGEAGPEMARLKNGHIVAERWSARSKSPNEE